MQDDIDIRMATIDDLPALKRVGAQLFDHRINEDRSIEFLNDPRHHLVLAFNEGHIVGMASGFHYVHPDKDPELFVNEVGVIVSQQNRGIGRGLVKFLCEHAKNIGCTEAWVLTNEQNTAAQKAYLAAAGVRKGADTILFEFKL